MSFIPEESISEILNTADIVDVVSEFVVLKKKGKNFFGICPFHSEKTPSFSVTTSKQIYHCFGCSAGGNVFTFLMKYNGINFPESVKLLAKRYDLEHLLDKAGSGRKAKRKINPIIITEKDVSYNPNSSRKEDILNLLRMVQFKYKEELRSNASSGANTARKYLKDKKIGKELVEKIGMGYAPSNDVLMNVIMQEYVGTDRRELIELFYRSGLLSDNNFRSFTNRITFPVTSVDGKILGFNARVLNGQKENKYFNSPSRELYSKSHLVYGLNHIDVEQVENEGLYLVEGYTDLFGFIEQGHSALGIAGSNITSGQIGIIKKLNPKQIFIISDGDKAGCRSAVKSANYLVGGGVVSLDDIYIAPVETEKDAFDIFYSDEQDVLDYCKKEAMSPSDFIFSNDPRTDLEFNIEKMNDFLEQNSYHILNEEQYDEKGISYQRVNNRHVEVDLASPLVLGEAFGRKQKVVHAKEVSFDGFDLDL